MSESKSNEELWAEVTAWLEDNWDPDLSVEAWWKTVGAAGWTAPHFTPEQGGRGLSIRSQAVVRKCFAEFGALRPPGGLGLVMAAPTILNMGNAEQIDRHVAPILEGRLGWAQLFSEPGAGSDLAGLTTRAERDGDRWVINGQKVWSSQAMQCDYGMLLARTNFDVPKHKGISWFAFELDQPGVTIRPLKEMTGDDIFNEIFIDDAVVDDADLIGGEGNGWMVTQTTLHFERTGIGAGGGMAGFPFPGPKGGMWGQRAGDCAPIQPKDSKLTLGYDDVAALAKRIGRSDDPVVRQELARLYSDSMTGLWNAQRAKQTGAASLGSIAKMTQTRIVKRAAGLAASTSGAHGTLAGADGLDAGIYSKAMVFSAASSIYGGADEIQRNIVAERTLGLPKEPNPDTDRPYGDVLRGR